MNTIRYIAAVCMTVSLASHADVVTQEQLTKMLPDTVLMAYTDVYNQYNSTPVNAIIINETLANGNHAVQMFYDYGMDELPAQTLLFTTDAEGNMLDLVKLGDADDRILRSTYATLNAGQEMPEFARQQLSDGQCYINTTNDSYFDFPVALTLYPSDSDRAYEIYNLKRRYRIAEDGTITFDRYIDDSLLPGFHKLTADGYRVWHEWLCTLHGPEEATEEVVKNAAHLIAERPVSAGLRITPDDLVRIIRYWESLDTDTPDPIPVGYNYQSQISLYPTQFAQLLRDIPIDEAAKFDWLHYLDDGWTAQIKDPALRTYVTNALTNPTH